ncbi:MAG: hypothetical protein NTX86_05480 [Candidatus Dependentiae bacterium]|nr:hypothetical protein [Candidatus Dependentiae bacterium]
MVSLKSAEFFITMISFSLAYIFVVTFVGYFRAWVTDKMGDDSAVNAGFLTLNPAQHFDLVGYICLLWLHFGWGSHMPLNPHNIVARSPLVRWIKLIIAYWSDAIAHIVLATFSITGLVLMFGGKVIGVSVDMMMTGELSHMRFAALYPGGSSIAISFALVLIASVYLNVFLAVFNLVFRGLELVMIYLIERSPHYAQYNNLATIFLYAIVVSIFVTPQLRWLLMVMIAHMGYLIACLFGAL